jgi:hypothetical protein
MNKLFYYYTGQILAQNNGRYVLIYQVSGGKATHPSSTIGSNLSPVAIPASGSRRPYFCIGERERHPAIQIFIQSVPLYFLEKFK